MKALVHTKPETLEYKEVPMPKCLKPTDVIIKTRAVGICGGDVHGFTGTTGRRIPPVIMGHEIGGEVYEVGKGSKFRVGDRVTVDSTVFCGDCASCKIGRVNMCEDRKVLGVSCDAYRQDGAMAEVFVVPEWIMYKLPENVNFVAGALIEPASVSFHALSLSRVTAESTVLVVGAGVIGLFVVQGLRIRGCKNIVVVDMNPGRLAIAKDYGAKTVINVQVQEGGPQKVIEDLYGTVDVSFEAIGLPQTVDLAIRAIKKKGQAVLIGNLSPRVSVHLQDIVTGEKTISGVCASAGEYEEVTSHLSEGRLDVEKLITKVAPLEEGEKWFKELLGGKGSHIKIVLTNE